MVRPVKIDVSKLELLPVPDRMSMRYRHNYREVYPQPGTHEFTRMIEVGLEKYKPTKVLLSTTATLVDKETGEFLATAIASVSKNDVPNKKLGRTIAHNRALKQWKRIVERARLEDQEDEDARPNRVGRGAVHRVAVEDGPQLAAGQGA